MNFFQINHVYLLVCLVFVSCHVTVSLSVSGVVQYISALTYEGFDALRCGFFVTCCNEEWIISDVEGLKENLEKKVHGQHLVQSTVLGHIKGHLRTKDPPKALVLSFHGPTGVGKNFVCRIIAENLYKHGLYSKFVHLISATKEFPHEGMIAFYKDQLRQWIEGNVTICEQSMFVFDEIDKMPGTLLDIIKPYIDYYQHLGGVNYRRAIFIFLSNTGSSMVTQRMLEHWKSGKRREQLQLKDIENSILLSAINDKNQNGLWHSQVISNNLVTAYIPFLPLERAHIRLCIQDMMLAHNYFDTRQSITEELENKVIDELKFPPEMDQVFSSTGCKRVSEKVDLVMSNYFLKDEL